MLKRTIVKKEAPPAIINEGKFAKEIAQMQALQLQMAPLKEQLKLLYASSPHRNKIIEQIKPLQQEHDALFQQIFIAYRPKASSATTAPCTAAAPEVHSNHTSPDKTQPADDDYLDLLGMDPF